MLMGFSSGMARWCSG